ncbi:MAG: hypothetical protein Q4B09_07390 [Lachnospiraceae bacterium]|nr:hypothetical protein [Lachnospiraceae bacterium]
MNGTNKFTEQRYQEFYSLPEGDVDLLFIGSSHSYCTFNPANFPAYRGYQLGTPLQHADTSYYVLKDALKHQTPKIVVQEVYWDMLDDDFDLKQASTFFSVLDDDSIRKEYIDEVFPLAEKFKYSIPAIRYQSDYFAYRAAKINANLETAYGVAAPKENGSAGNEYYVNRGYVYCDTIMPEAEYDRTNQFKTLNGNNLKISDTQTLYLKKIKTLCDQNNILLIFVTAPIAPVSMNYIRNYHALHDQIASIADQLEVPYLDYNLIDLGLTDLNFRDDAHLNDSGVNIVDEHFNAWLNNLAA